MSLHARSTSCSHDQGCVSLPPALQERLALLRERLERRFLIRLSDEELLAYLFEKALDRMEEWETRTRGASGEK